MRGNLPVADGPCVRVRRRVVGLPRRAVGLSTRRTHAAQQRQCLIVGVYVVSPRISMDVMHVRLRECHSTEANQQKAQDGADPNDAAGCVGT